MYRPDSKLSLALLLVLMLVPLLPASALATDRTAATCNAADIQAQINLSADGDRVIVPAGSCTWGTTDSLEFGTKGVTVIGAGTLPSSRGSNGNVVINLPSTSANTRFIAMPGGSASATNQRQRISNITFQISSANTNFLSMNCVGGFAPVVEHLTVTNTGSPWNGYVFVVSGYNCGVIANNIVTTTNLTSSSNTQYLHCAPGVANDVDAPWAKKATYGVLDTTGEQNIYFENNEVRNFTTADINLYCRAVFRYNDIYNANISSHGFDTDPVGARHIEVYNNKFYCTGANISTWIGMRGGTWVVHDNTIPFQATLCNNFGGTGWPDGAVPSVWILAAGPACYQGTYPSHHQFGWGWNGGSTIAQNDDGFPTHYGQDREPTYWWNNVRQDGVTTNNDINPKNALNGFQCNGAPSCQCDASHPQQDISVFVQLNRDYFLRAPQNGDPGILGTTGYMTYTYPHPLTSQASSATSSTGASPQPTTGAVPPAPSGLTIK